jgi:hypothetical protein
MQLRTIAVETHVMKMLASAIENRVRSNYDLWDYVKCAHQLPIMRVGPVWG